MPNKNVITIPKDLIPEFEAWGKSTANLFGKLRSRSGLKPMGVPEDQSWFWTRKWQAMEREADKAVANGDYVEFEDIDEGINYLHKQA